MRCRCGQLLRGSAKRCRACAIDYLKQWDTDRFEVQAQNEPIVLTEKEIEMWQEFTPRSIPVRKTMRQVTPWSEEKWRREQTIKLLAGLAILVVVGAIAAWAVLS